jgi:CRP-like cAMP-binding protein
MQVIKVDENEVMDILNDGLRSKLTMEINGRLLSKFKVFSSFPIEFLSALAFLFQKQHFGFSEEIFHEGEESTFIGVINTGKVHLIHHKSQTFLSELHEGASFGEVGFFSGRERSCTIVSKEFTEILIIMKNDFMELASEVSGGAILKFH